MMAMDGRKDKEQEWEERKHRIGGEGREEAYLGIIERQRWTAGETRKSEEGKET